MKYFKDVRMEYLSMNQIMQITRELERVKKILDRLVYLDKEDSDEVYTVRLDFYSQKEAWLKERLSGMPMDKEPLAPSISRNRANTVLWNIKL